jgi:hypothetical protein
VVFRHLTAGLEVGTDVAFFEGQFFGLKEHPHQLTGEAAGLSEEQDTPRHFFVILSLWACL